MTDYENWNKKFVLFASGLINALCFRIPISIAGFCIVRFRLDIGLLGIFTSRMVNGMLIGQLFGNWLGVLFTALGGKGKLCAIVASSWLCLISWCFTLFCFCHSEEGHLTCFYWSLVVVNFFAKVSDALCINISLESTNWYVSTSTLSPIYVSLIKTLLVMLFSMNDNKHAADKVNAIATRSAKTTVDYSVPKWMILWTIILMFLISALWTAVSLIVTIGKLKSSNIKWLKYVTGVSTGSILSVPGALFGAAVGSMFEKCSTHCLKEASWLKVMESRDIIFCVVGALMSFGSVIAGMNDMPDEAEQWMRSSKWGVNVDVSKYAGGGFVAGVFLGLCFGAMAYRFKADICRSMVLCLIAGSLLGSALGILIYERLSSFVKLKANPTSDATIDHHDQSKLVESGRVNASASNSSGETLEELLKKKVDIKDLPTLQIIRDWSNYTPDGESTGVDHNNNKWAKALQKIQKVDVTRYGYWNFLNTKVERTASINGNILWIQLTLSIPYVSGQSLLSSEHEKIKNAIEETVNNRSNGSVTVTNVKWERTHIGTVVFSVEARVNGNTDENNIMIFAEHGLKSVGNVTYSMKGHWDFSNATVDKFTGLNDYGFQGQRANNQIIVMVKSVSGTKNGDTLEGETAKEKIKKAIQGLFDSELGSEALMLEKVETCMYQDQIKISVTLSSTENIWARSLRTLKRLQLNEKDYWDLTEATVSVGGVTQDMTNRITITVNLQGAKEYQSAGDDVKEKLKKTLQKNFDNAYGDRAVTAEQLTAHVNAENTITIAFNLKKNENVWTKFIQNIDFVNVNNGGEWQLSQGRLESDLVMRGNLITIQTTLSGAGALGQTMDLTEEKRLKLALQEEFDRLIPGHVTVTSVTGMTKYLGQIVFTTEGEGRRLTLSAQENIILRKALHNVFRNGKVKYSKNSYWYFNNAKVDLTSRGVTTKGNMIKLNVKDVAGAAKGDTFEKLYQDKIKPHLQEAIDKKMGNDRVVVTSVTGKGTDAGKVELIVVVEKMERKKVVSMRSRREVLTKKNSTTDAVSLKKSEVICGWVSSVIMSVLSQGTIYSVYPGMAPCSITDSSYFNKINIVIQIVSTIPSIVIIYVSETSGGPEKRWEEEGKRWYVGLLFVILQIVSMIIVVSVVHRPNSKLAKALTANPVAAGVLTVLMVLCQVTSTSIGYAGVVANSGFTMMSFNNTATLTTSVSMSLLGEGYLTEVKKYEPGMWPTQGMGKWATYKWWCGKAFRNAWQILLRICTKDLRRDMNIFATNNKHSSAIIFV